MEQLDRNSSGMRTTLKTFDEKRCNLILLDCTKKNIFDGFESTPPLIRHDNGFTDPKEGAALKKKSRNAFNAAYLVRTGEQHVNRELEGRPSCVYTRINFHHRAGTATTNRSSVK